MSENLTTLSRTEAVILSAFIYQVDNWKNQYGEKADNIEIVYHADDDDFEISTSDKPTKRGRINAMTADILTWANSQLKQLQGYDNQNSVTAFTCSYKDNRFGVAVQTAPQPVNDTQQAEQV